VPCSPVDGPRYGHRLDEEVVRDVLLCRCALPGAGDAQRLLLDAVADERQADHVVAVEHHVEAVVAAHLATQQTTFIRLMWKIVICGACYVMGTRELTAANGTIVAPNLAAIRTNSELAGQKSL